MIIFSVAFLAGTLLVQFCLSKPPLQYIGIMTIAWIMLCGIFYYATKKISISTPIKRISIVLIATGLGFLWALHAIQIKTDWKLPDNMEGKTIEAEGLIASIPNVSNHFTSFQFKVQSIKFENESYKKSGLIKLTWRSSNNVSVHIGDRWKLKIRLKKIHGLANPGSMNYELYALQAGIRATGYVVNKEAQIRLEHSRYYFLFGQWREYLKNKIETHLPLSNTSPWITALVVGERQGIAQDNWEILRNTGTNHLMAIAGLHVGFMAGFFYFIVNFLWRLFPGLLLILPSQQVASLGALLSAFFYSALAGFSLPTQRACIMLSAFLITRLMKIKTVAWQVWSIALLLVLIINPLVILTESFWLSFGAVAFIIYGAGGRLSAGRGLGKWTRLQWITGISLIPFCLWLFQQCSLVSLVANAIAIPWVGFVVLPLSFIGVFLLFISTKLGALILMAADQSLAWLWWVLTYLSHGQWASWFHSLSNLWILLASVIGICLFLLPKGFPGKFFGFIWLMPLLLIQPAKPQRGELWVHLLDVGQGLSTVLQTEHHVLIFDAGAKTSPQFDMGESVVTPFLYSQGISRIDMLVVSHGDNDHSGGVGAILKRFPVTDVRSSVPEEIHFSPGRYCLAGQSWEWDGLQFAFLYPTPDHLGKGNNSSCVLRVSNGVHQVLLTGDIEKAAEKYLVATSSSQLPATVLVAPHHGSKTSAVESFLQAVHPELVLFPIGYRNRYHFPHPSVLEKYAALNSIKLDTASAGKITVKIHAQQIEWQTYRHYL